jgi:hypothetical protein
MIALFRIGTTSFDDHDLGRDLGHDLGHNAWPGSIDVVAHVEQARRLR